MDHVQILEQIRSLIREKLILYGGAAEQSPREAMLIRDGFFCGRRFTSDGLHAVWFIEENEVKFFDREGAIVEVLELTADNILPEQMKDEPRRAA